MVRTARELGVRVVCGSDAGVFAHGGNARELELLCECGFTPAEALRSATVDAARVLEHEELGVVRAGAVADLVAFDGDPLADVHALRGPRLVVRAGRVAFERR
jgi:imidazolonepropionase-like amidohydrolase